MKKVKSYLKWLAWKYLPVSAKKYNALLEEYAWTDAAHRDALRSAEHELLLFRTGTHPMNEA